MSHQSSQPDSIAAESFASGEVSTTTLLSSNAEPERLPSVGRLPAVTVFLGFAAGILCDRIGDLTYAGLVSSFLVVCAGWCVSRASGRRRVAAVLTVVICILSGAVHHHYFWHGRRLTDISGRLTRAPVLIRCTGIVATEATVTPPRESPFGNGLPPQSSTRFQVDTTEVVTAAGSQEVSGRLEVVIDGVLQTVHVGDHVEIQGWSQASRPRVNPGGFDGAAFHRSQGVRGIVRVDHPDLVRVIHVNTSGVERVRRLIRSRAEAVLDSGVSDDVRPIAMAMLLGDRSMLDQNARNAFVESGTMHLLAISGLHIGILMMFLLASGRIMGLSGRHAIVLAMLVLGIYLQIADCRPPMIRAFVIILIWSAGQIVRRPAFGANSLGVAALAITGLSPGALFDVGTQLSFLAVAVIFWLTAIVRRSRSDSDTSAASPSTDRSQQSHAALALLRYPWLEPLQNAGRKIGYLWLVSGSIWLISAPLIVSVFNVISPAGLAINVFLIPVVSIGLCFGFAAVLIGIVSPALAWPAAFVFDVFLKGLLRVVDCAASIEMGHAWVPDPPGWWLIVFYGLVAVAMLATTFRRRSSRCWSGVGAWMIFGLTLLPADRNDTSLRCTFLSVGHGLSVIVESPDGKTLVYDAGSRGGGSFAARVLNEALWARGLSKVDVLIVSHADVDHYNGVTGLLDAIPVGTIFCSRHFPDYRQPPTLEMFERAAELGVPTKLIARGDIVQLGSAFSIRILQPVASATYGSDNAASIVALIEYQNRRILLTGDLDDEGLDELLGQPSTDVDVLLAPHHGAPAASPRALAEWATPEWVIASSPTNINRLKLQSLYGPDSDVVMTSDAGAVTVEITGDGRLSVDEFTDSRP